MNYKYCCVEVIVASISRLKSSSCKLAFAVSKSRKVSSGDRRSAEGNASRPDNEKINALLITCHTEDENKP